MTNVTSWLSSGQKPIIGCWQLAMSRLLSFSLLGHGLFFVLFFLTLEIFLWIPILILNIEEAKILFLSIKNFFMFCFSPWIGPFHLLNDNKSIFCPFLLFLMLIVEFWKKNAMKLLSHLNKNGLSCCVSGPWVHLLHLLSYPFPSSLRRALSSFFFTSFSFPSPPPPPAPAPPLLNAVSAPAWCSKLELAFWITQNFGARLGSVLAIRFSKCELTLFARQGCRELQLSE